MIDMSYQRVHFLKPIFHVLGKYPLIKILLTIILLDLFILLITCDSDFINCYIHYLSKMH